jgi:hypothetical protein
LVAGCKEAAHCKGLRAITRRGLSHDLERLRDAHGEKTVGGLRARHI